MRTRLPLGGGGEGGGGGACYLQRGGPALQPSPRAGTDWLTRPGSYETIPPDIQTTLVRKGSQLGLHDPTSENTAPRQPADCAGTASGEG